MGNCWSPLPRALNCDCWDGMTGKPLETEQDAFRGDLFPFFWVGFSPNGKYLVACGGHGDEVEGVKFAVWSVESRRQLYQKSVNLDRTIAPLKRLVIFSASISPDSQTLATNGENSVALWDLATGVRRNETEATGGLVYRVEFSPAGKLMASVNYEASGVVTLWDSSTGKVVGSLTGHEGQVRAMAFTHDGKTLATGGQDRTVRWWDVATRQQKNLLLGPDTASNADRVAGTTAATETAEPVAAQPAPSEKTADAPPLDASTTVAFERDPVQLPAGAFDVWSLSFSGDDQFLAASGGGGGRWDDQKTGAGAHLGFWQGQGSCLLSHAARHPEHGPLARWAASRLGQLVGRRLAARSRRGRNCCTNDSVTGCGCLFARRKAAGRRHRVR